MIRKFRIGEPIFTDAVVKEIAISKELSIVSVEDNKIKYILADDDIVYGLGQSVRGLNKRGYVYKNIATDSPNQTESQKSLYGVHNFLIISGKKNFGLFVDTPLFIEFDVAFTKTDELVITANEADFDLYLIEADTAYDVVKEFRALIGESYIPPKWGFGYGQSRWGYKTAEDVREVVKKHRENNIPLDSVYLDIDYMQDFKDFSINEDAFPDFENFVKEMKKEHIHLVPIIDAGVKIQDGYDVYEEGVKNNYFCKDENGNDLVAGVWPGDVHFPDFLNPETRKWFGKKYDFLISKGIDGFWNDMNEPAIFYFKDRLEGIFDVLDSFRNRELDIYSYFDFVRLPFSLFNNLDDYKKMYNKYDGKIYRHDKVHNIYGFNMTRAAGEHFKEIGKDILMFSRSSYIGAHRYGGIWQGDNHAWWSHLKLNITMTMSLNMIGFLFTGADIGGFGEDVSPQLMLRWLEFGIFTPLMRNHSAWDTKRQEVYRFDNMADMRNIIEIRYGLIDYLYEQFVKAAKNNEMYMRPISFDYPEDEIARRVEDQVLVGDDIMIAPVYEQNAVGRYVYLPEKMKMYRLRSLNDMDESIMEKGHHYVDVALNEVLIFVREGKDFDFGKGAMYVED